MQNGTENIENLINGCRRKERRAQEELYRTYFRAMMGLCVRYTRNEADAMEALNTGFFKVFQHIDRYDAAKGTLYTWMRTIVINSCLALARDKSEPANYRELDTAELVEIEPEIISQLSSADILALVRQLPPATQAVFNLYVMEGYAHKEIAGMMGISENTSKWHLSEGRKKLQALITKLRMDR